MLNADNFEEAGDLVRSTFSPSNKNYCGLLVSQQDKVELYLTVLTFIDKVRSQELADAIQLLKHDALRTGKATVPVWEEKGARIVQKPVQALAGLLCYSNPVE